MEADSVNAIIKIGKSEHIDRLQKLGEIYLNTWGYFRRFELNDAQGDKHEGLAEIYQVVNGVQLFIGVGEEWVPIGGLRDQLKFYAGRMDDFNLFCMFAVTRNTHKYLSHPGLKKFGDSSLVMTDGDEFISRLTRKLNAEGIPHKHALVDYVDKEAHEGDMGPFRKLSPFGYQSEWRICAEARKACPLVVHLGDLSDISVRIPTSELSNKLSFAP